MCETNETMDQDTAKKLLFEGASFVFLGVPQGTQFGINMNCWNTDEDFRGIKMIPPGLHYIHYSAVNQHTGDVGHRSGFMHCFKKGEMVVKMWDKKGECISSEVVSEESVDRLKSNFIQVQKYLAPYPLETSKVWKLLTSQITVELAKKLSPEDGIIRSAVELLSVSDKDRPRGKSKVIGTDPETSSSNEDNTTDTGQKKRLSLEEKENAMLPNLKPKPGTALRFTEISKNLYPAGSEPKDITKHCLDQTYTLELILRKYDDPIHIIGELQFAYICFLIGHSLDAFEQWKAILALLCGCDQAMNNLTYLPLFCQFVRVIEAQIEEMPKEFLADIVANKNWVYKIMSNFFRNCYIGKVESRLMTMVERLRDNLTNNLQWDFSMLDSEDEDERPVVVCLDE